MKRFQEHMKANANAMRIDFALPGRGANWQFAGPGVDGLDLPFLSLVLRLLALGFSAAAAAAAVSVV